VYRVTSIGAWESSLVYAQSNPTIRPPRRGESSHPDAVSSRKTDHPDHNRS